jgi:hypothetical protein
MQAVYYRKVLADQRVVLAEELVKAHKMLARRHERGDVFAVRANAARDSSKGGFVS